MSTSIALQNLYPQENGTVVRHRFVSKTDTTDPGSPPINDERLNSPHDAAFSGSPLGSRSLKPTNTYWISPHGLISRDIKILDLTNDIRLEFTGLTKPFKDHVKRTLKDHSFAPVFTVTRNTWSGLSHTITDSDGKTMADWKHPWVSTSEAVLTFPEASTRSSHPISLSNKRWGGRTESFTINSVPFVWEMDSFWHSLNMTLYKFFGSGEREKKIEVARFAEDGWGFFISGGTLVVDETELDGLVACLTLLVVLKKKRQRGAERRPR